MWLLKTEPTSYSFSDLERDRRTVWDGVKNPAALKQMRAMKKGDQAFIYHTGDERSAVGIAEIVREAYPDPELADPKRAVVDIKKVARLKRPVTLQEMKSLATFEGSPLVRQGRLSVVPLTKSQWAAVCRRGEK